MAQLILNIEDNSLVPKLKAAVRMLQGVVSVKVVNKDEESKPNEETLEAIEEMRSGHYAGKLDTSSKDLLLESLMKV